MAKILFTSLSDFEIENLFHFSEDSLTIAAILQYHETAENQKCEQSKFISIEEILRKIQSRNFSQFDFTEISPEYLTSTHRQQIIALEMMLRIDTTKDMRFVDRRDIFFFFSAFWLKKLKAMKPDAIYFGVIPHEVGDYILYVVAKHLGIDTIVNVEAYILGRRRICNSIEFPQESHPAINYQEFQDSNRNLERWLSEQREIKVRQYVSWMAHIDDLKPNKYENWIFLRFLRRAWIYFLNMSEKSKISKVDSSKIYQTNLKGTEKFFGKLIYSMKKFISLEIINFERRLIAFDRVQIVEQSLPAGDFVVLFLHYQPEMLVSPVAGDYFDQIQNVAMIAGSLPDGWNLLIKEHPAQQKDSYGYNYLGRDPLYYSKLTSIPRVHLVNTEIRSHELILKSKGVATISGTVGWQALVLLKPVLVFGNVWYGNAPNAYIANSRESIVKFFGACKRTSTLDETKTSELLKFLEAYHSDSVQMQTNKVSSLELGIDWDQELNLKNWNILIRQICDYYRI